MSAIANFHNWFVDKDFLWWPFAWMRPAKNELMTFKKTGQIALAFGGLITAIFIGLSIMEGRFSFEYLFYLALMSFGFFWIWFSFVTKPLWNVRVYELRIKK